jgi:DNA-binding NarL/FixJ family response regulator
VVGFADARQPCGWAVEHANADVILVNDVGAPAVTLTRLREARAGSPQATIICRTSHDDAERVASIVDAGADATVDAQVDSVRMRLLIREIAAGSVFHAHRNAHPPNMREVVADLTTRELEVLQLMAAGATNSSIARQLWVTEQTVKFHLSNTYRKLGVANRTEASHFAHVNGLMEPGRAPAPDKKLADPSAMPSPITVAA